MGLLDEAIREHLELKRLRGADPSEVIRQEREALGVTARQEASAYQPDETAGPFEDEVIDEALETVAEHPTEGAAVPAGAEGGHPAGVEPVDEEPAAPPAEPEELLRPES